MKISCITLSYNKPTYITEAIESVYNQSYKDFDYLVIDNSTVDMPYFNVDEKRGRVLEKTFTKEEREKEYIPAVLLNEYFDKLPGDIIMYLSDDDLFYPTCFEKVAQFFDSHPEAMVCYFGMNSIKGSNARGWQENGHIRSQDIYHKGTNLDCVIDGGQVAFRKECLAKLEKPYFVTDWQNASHCDGLFLTKLCEQFDFYPINEVLLTHRTTELSTHADK